MHAPSSDSDSLKFSTRSIGNGDNAIGEGERESDEDTRKLESSLLTRHGDKVGVSSGRGGTTRGPKKIPNLKVCM